MSVVMEARVWTQVEFVLDFELNFVLDFELRFDITENVLTCL